VEDWEQHFAEKSRRRFEKERAERRRMRRGRMMAALAVGSSHVAGLVGLAILR
jgi:hypothetical protein